MKISLKGMTRKELEKLSKDIEKQLEKLAAQEKRDALAAAEKAAKALGYSLADLTGDTPLKAQKPTKKDGRSQVAPKYRNPDGSGETWTGRGRKPKWVEAHLAAGKTLESILIK
ncbi:MAG: H-NS family nucleoid-associated regulatory protein [Maritimibacter sp.]